MKAWIGRIGQGLPLAAAKIKEKKQKSEEQLEKKGARGVLI